LHGPMPKPTVMQTLLNRPTRKYAAATSPAPASSPASSSMPASTTSSTPPADGASAPARKHYHSTAEYMKRVALQAQRESQILAEMEAQMASHPASAFASTSASATSTAVNANRNLRRPRPGSGSTGTSTSLQRVRAQDQTPRRPATVCIGSIHPLPFAPNQY
jgi:hypothetical protein